MRKVNADLDLLSGLSRRRFVAGSAALAATSLLAGPSAASAKLAAPDLGRSVRTRLLDATIDVSAETGFVSVTPAKVARRAGVRTAEFRRLFPDRKDHIVQTIDRVFVRRIETYYANAGRLGSNVTSVDPGIEALSRQFPDTVWIAYWDILFAIRGDEETSAAVRKTTTKYDNEFGTVIPAYFPTDLSPDDAFFALGQFDALGIDALTWGTNKDRGRQIPILSRYLTSRRGV